MVAESPSIDPNVVEREIIAQFGAAKLRLRFDKVALRLVGGLKAALARAVPEGETPRLHNQRPDKTSCEDGCDAGPPAAQRADGRGAP
jgi:hypothetical protein